MYTLRNVSILSKARSPMYCNPSGSMTVFTDVPSNASSSMIFYAFGKVKVVFLPSAYPVAKRVSAMAKMHTMNRFFITLSLLSRKM